METNQSNKESLLSKEVILWAIANSNSDFERFYKQYKNQLYINDNLLDGFVEKAWRIIMEDEENVQLAEQYEKNQKQMKKYSISGISAMSIVFAVIFLLGFHLRIHRSKEGKWDVLIEYKAPENSLNRDLIEMVKEIIHPNI